MPARTGSRHAKRKRIAEEGMGPIIPHRKDYNKLKPIEKSSVLYVGSVYREIFDAQVEGRYKFEVRANDNALGYAFCPQYVVPGGPKKYVHLRVGYSLDLPCGVFPLRGSRTTCAILVFSDCPSLSVLGSYDLSNKWTCRKRTGEFPGSWRMFGTSWSNQYHVN